MMIITIKFNYIIIFQTNNMKCLCKTISETTRNTSPSLLHKATATEKKFESLLTLFAHCQSKYNSNEAVEDTEYSCYSNISSIFILVVDREIKEFVCFFRTNFPDNSFPP